MRVCSVAPCTLGDLTHFSPRWVTHPHTLVQTGNSSPERGSGRPKAAQPRGITVRKQILTHQAPPKPPHTQEHGGPPPSSSPPREVKRNSMDVLRLLEARSGGLELGRRRQWPGPARAVSNPGPAPRHTTWGHPMYLARSEAGIPCTQSRTHVLLTSVHTGPRVGTDVCGLGHVASPRHAPCPLAAVLVTHGHSSVHLGRRKHRARGPRRGDGRLQAASPSGPGAPSSGSGPNGSACSGRSVGLASWPAAQIPQVEGS